MDTPRRPANDRSEKNSPENDRPDPQQADLVAVGIGASAGGLQALEQFFSQVEQTGFLSYLVVQHLMKDYKSMLPDLLSAHIDLPVKEMQDNSIIEADTVYVSPPHTIVSIEQGRIRLSEPERQSESMHPIDAFFRSLALAFEKRAACVILSGTGTDGTLGLKEIHARTGLCIAQAPDTCEYEGMPASAVKTGFVDYVLAPKDMADALVTYFKNISQDNSLPLTEGPWLTQLFQLLKSHTGHEFSPYKKNTLLRRIHRRMNIHEINSPEQYLEFLRDNEPAIKLLFSDLLVGVTSFFREPEAFEFLAHSVLAPMLKDRDAEESLRVWVPGCSTGEEVYSLAIVIKEKCDELGVSVPIQLFASDIDPDSIATARQALYPDSIEADVSQTRLQRFFEKQENHYRINPDIRDMVVFSIQDVLRDPPFTSLDLLCCRNLLIYLNAEAQRKLIPLFHYALKDDCVLILGRSESIGKFSDIFRMTDKNVKIFKKTGDALMRRYALQFPVPFAKQSAEREKHGPEQEPNKRQKDTRLRDYILSHIAPLTILIDKNKEIQYISGDAANVLSPSQGYPSHNLLDMVQAEVQAALSASISKAQRAGSPVKRSHVRARINAEEHYINLTVRPVPEEEAFGGSFLITFEIGEKPQQLDQAATASLQQEELKNRVKDLEKELEETRESYQITVEELETSNEEIKSMNEELQSSNEELQSTNEELESSKEELQSLNEELSSMNTELQEKVEALSTARDDMNNILNSSNLAALFLDAELQIRRFTPAMERLINLRQEDVGRPLRHFSHNLSYPQLHRDAQEVLQSLQIIEKEIRSESGEWYFMRMLPYKTGENAIAGVTITFIDITEMKRNRDQLKFALELSDNILDTIREALLILDGDLKVIKANHSFYTTFLVKARDTIGQRIYDLGNQQWDNARLRELLEKVIPEDHSFEGFTITHEFPLIGERTISINARRVVQRDGSTERILMAFEDITPHSSGTARG